MDKFVREKRELILKKYNDPSKHFTKFKWQKSYHNHIIRDEKDLEKHCNYAVYNHQKHGLPDDWKYTSLNYKELTDEVIL